MSGFAEFKKFAGMAHLGASASASNLQYLNSATGWDTPITNLGTPQLLTQIVIPAGQMSGATSQFDLAAEFTITIGSASNKTIQITDASSGLVLFNLTGAFGGSSYLGIAINGANKDSNQSQYFRSAAIANPLATGGGSGAVFLPIYSNLDFSVARTLNVYVTLPTGRTTDAVKLEKYRLTTWL